MAFSRGSLNKIMLIGNIGADPELRSLPDGGSVVNFNVATSESWVDKSTSERREQTEWHRVTFFGKAAEIIHQYGRKGSKIYIEGSVRTRKWKDRDGNDRYTTEVRGEDFTFLGSRPNNGGESRDNYSRDNYSQHGGGGGGAGDGGDSFSNMDDDDIPF